MPSIRVSSQYVLVAGLFRDCCDRQTVQIGAENPPAFQKTEELGGTQVHLPVGILASLRGNAADGTEGKRGGRTKRAGFVRPLVSQSQFRNLGVGGSGGLLVPVGFPALLDLFVLLLLGVVQDRLYAAVAFLTDAVHLCLSIAGSERGIGA